nr:PREDICTED: la-related protein 6-like [Latimeria chalumnae]|eukprot:XP_005989902.1 PREDICTED: la-related protein 6-like [Latimeria chalumnae]
MDMSASGPWPSKLGSPSSSSTPVEVRANPYQTAVHHHLRQRHGVHSPCPAQEDLCEGLEGSFCDFNETFEGSFLEVSDWKPPDSKLICKINSQIEFYLSDENLAEDAFLLKHVQRNKKGYVSIKLLTSFKRVKNLTRDWKVVLQALRSSELLEVNEEGTKVRRKKPVPQCLLSVPPTRMLLAWNLPKELPPEYSSSSTPPQKSIIETTMRIFGAHGMISYVRILRPGKELPADLQKYKFKYPELGARVCALVEYEYLEGARKAYEGLSKTFSSTSGEGMKVVLLGGRGSRKKNCGVDSEESEDTEAMNSHPARKPNRTSERLRCALEESLVYSSSESDGTSFSPIEFHRPSRPLVSASESVLSSSGNFKPSPLSIPALPRKFFAHSQCPSPGQGMWSSPGSSPEVPSKMPNCLSDSGIGLGSSWVQRRKMAVTARVPNVESRLTPSLKAVKKTQDTALLPEAVVRLPYGPDGTKGFYNSIGRGKLVLRH